MPFTSCGGLTVFTSTATMLRSVRQRSRSMPSRALRPPHDGVQTPGAVGGIEHVHVEAEIDRPLADLVAELGHALGEAAADQLVDRHDLVAEAHRARHDALRVGRAADADVPGEFGIDQAFLGDVGELGGGVVLLLRAVGIGVGVRIDVERRHLRVLLADRARDRDGDRAVAADGDRHGAGLHDAVDRLLGALEGVDDLAGRQLDVAAIDQARAPSPDRSRRWSG